MPPSTKIPVQSGQGRVLCRRALKLAAAGRIQLDGDQSVLSEFAGRMDEFDPNFNIVTP